MKKQKYFAITEHDHAALNCTFKQALNLFWVDNVDALGGSNVGVVDDTTSLHNLKILKVETKIMHDDARLTVEDISTEESVSGNPFQKKLPQKLILSSFEDTWKQQRTQQ